MMTLVFGDRTVLFSRRGHMPREDVPDACNKQRVTL